MYTVFCYPPFSTTKERLQQAFTYLGRRGIDAHKTLTGKTVEIKAWVPDHMAPDRAEDLIKNAFAGSKVEVKVTA
jgi:hypothetical protein